MMDGERGGDSDSRVYYEWPRRRQSGRRQARDGDGDSDGDTDTAGATTTSNKK